MTTLTAWTPPRTAATPLRRPTTPTVATAPAPASHVRTTICRHELGGLPCVNERPHPGGGRGCVHLSTSGVPDRHDYGDDE